MLTPKLVKNVRVQGSAILKELRDMVAGHPLVREIRGVGLMIGIQLNAPGAPLVEACRGRGLLINCTQNAVLRFLPPLALSGAERRMALRILRDVFDEARKLGAKGQ